MPVYQVGDLVVIRRRGPGKQHAPPKVGWTTWVYHEIRGDLVIPDGTFGTVLELIPATRTDDEGYRVLISDGIVIVDGYKLDPCNQPGNLV